eukprot:363916_1
MAEAKKKLLTPHFEWCQDMNRVLIKILVADVNIKDKDLKIDVTKDQFSFIYKDYLLKFKFRFPVNPTTIKYKAMRVLELVIEKETSNAYWPHLLPKDDKKKLKNQCKVDWNRFLDEDEAKKKEKGIVNEDDDEYGDLNMNQNEESSDDDSDDEPIDDLEVKPKIDDEKQEEKTNTNETVETQSTDKEKEPATEQEPATATATDKEPEQKPATATETDKDEKNEKPKDEKPAETVESGNALEEV